MKTLKKIIYRHYKQEVELPITNVIHNLPTWMFPEYFDSDLRTPCPICHKEMRLNIAHGQYIESCSMIQVVDFDVFPIHTECYNEIEEKEDKSDKNED